MKIKISKLSVCIAAMLGASVMPSMAVDFSDGLISYNIVSEADHTAEVAIAIKNSKGELNIPETVHDEDGVAYTVVGIATEAFKQNSWVKKLVMPNTMTYVGSYAFYRCKTLADVTYSISLQDVKESAFESCEALNNLIMPEGLKNIGTRAFALCGKATEIYIPGSCREVGSSAFYNCTSVDTLTMSQGVVDLNNYTFYGLAIKTLRLPKSFCNYNKGSFSGLNNLEKIILDPENPFFRIENGYLIDKRYNLLVAVPGGAKTIVNDIPESVTELGWSSFYGLTKIEEVVIPKTVTKVNQQTFYGCTALKRVTLSKKLNAIEPYVFQGCTSLESINIPISIQKIGDCAFHSCSSLKSVTVPDAVGEIGTAAFMNCTQLKSVTLGVSLEKIGASAFSKSATIATIYSKADEPPTLPDNAFVEDVCNTALLIVPEGRTAAYKAAKGWLMFQKCKEASDASNSVKVQPFDGAANVIAGEGAALKLTLVNETPETVDSLGYNLTIDGNTESAVCDTLEMGVFATAVLNLPVDKYAMGEHACSFELAKVNGKDNTSVGKKIDFTLNIIGKAELSEDAPKVCYADLTKLDRVKMKPNTHFEAAMKLNDPNMAGYKILGFKILNMPEGVLKNCRIFSSQNLEGYDGENEAATIEDGVLKGAFVNPPVLGQTGLYLGFTADADNEQTTVIPCAETDYSVPNLLYGKQDVDKFGDWSTYGALPIIIYVDGPVKENSVCLSAMKGSKAFGKQHPINATLEFRNYGGNEVKEIEYSYSVNGGDKRTGKITLDKPTDSYLSKIQRAGVEFEPVETAGTYDLSITVDKVNGEPNQWQSEPLTAPIIIGEKQTTRLPVMEEYTDVNCGWCPRGTIAIYELHKRYNDFIGATYHYADPMKTKAGIPFHCQGAPGCKIDRVAGEPIDPYFGANNKPFGIADYYASEREMMPPADIVLSTTWNDAMTEITSKAEVEFSYVEPGRKYSLGYFLTIDSLKQPGDQEWDQHNYYKGGTNSDPVLKRLCDGSFDLSAFDHVCFFTRDYMGVEGALPDTVAAGEEYTHDNSFKLTDNDLEDGDWLYDVDHSKINVIAILLDDTGLIRNARQVRAGEDSRKVVINDIVTSFGTEAVYYDLMGRRVANPHDGIFIRMQGSKATKVAL